MEQSWITTSQSCFLSEVTPRLLTLLGVGPSVCVSKFSRAWGVGNKAEAADCLERNENRSAEAVFPPLCSWSSPHMATVIARD